MKYPIIYDTLKHISCLLYTSGDSITYGYCADYGTDYVSLLRKQLKEDFPQMDITVKNKGENGETSREGLRRLEGDVLHYNPQLVIMLFGSNDCAFSDYQPVSYTHLKASV